MDSVGAAIEARLRAQGGHPLAPGVPYHEHPGVDTLGPPALAPSDLALLTASLIGNVGGTATVNAFQGAGGGAVPVTWQGFSGVVLPLQQGANRTRNIQVLTGNVVITAGTWANVGTTAVLTPPWPAAIFVWAYVVGQHSVTTTDWLRVAFDGPGAARGKGTLPGGTASQAAGGSGGGFAFATRDDALGWRQLLLMDDFDQWSPNSGASQGRITMQLQMTTDNNGTFTFKPSIVNSMLIALAFPSTSG